MGCRLLLPTIVGDRVTDCTHIRNLNRADHVGGVDLMAGMIPARNGRDGPEAGLGIEETEALGFRKGWIPPSPVLYQSLIPNSRVFVHPGIQNENGIKA